MLIVSSSKATTCSSPSLLVRPVDGLNSHIPLASRGKTAATWYDFLTSMCANVQIYIWGMSAQVQARKPKRGTSWDHEVQF